MVFLSCLGESVVNTREATLNILSDDLSELRLCQILTDYVLDAFVLVNVFGARLNRHLQFECLRVLLHTRRRYRLRDLGIALSRWIGSWVAEVRAV